jgi:integrase
MPRKRGHGEGSMYKRKNGLWSAQISVQGKRVTNYFKTQREGLDWLQQMRNQIRAGLTFTGAQLPLREFLSQWLGSIRESVKGKTLHQYGQIVRDHIAPRLGNIKLKDLRPDQIQALYNEKLDSGISARTVILIHAVLHRALKHALKQGIIGRNPTDAVNRPKFRRKEMCTLSDNQVRTLLLVVKDTRFEALFWIAVSTGLRQGELLGLRWSDLDWQSRRLHVQRQLQRVTGGLEFTEPKSAAGNRVVVLGEEAIAKLRKHQNILIQEKQKAEEKWEEHDLIFPSSHGTPLDHRNLYRFFKLFLKDAALPDIRFHDLRHTAATLMLQQGIHPKVVQERLGHADITLTLNTYSHVLPSMQEEAAEKLDELLTPIDVSDEINHIKETSISYG